MAEVTKEELFAAARLIKGYCKSRDECQVLSKNRKSIDEYQALSKDRCPFFTQFGSTWCVLNNCVPSLWPDQEEGGGEE